MAADGQSSLFGRSDIFQPVESKIDYDNILGCSDHFNIAVNFHDGLHGLP